jgi:hypothetical protein
MEQAELNSGALYAAGLSDGSPLLPQRREARRVLNEPKHMRRNPRNDKTNEQKARRKWWERVRKQIQILEKEMKNDFR